MKKHTKVKISIKQSYLVGHMIEDNGSMKEGLWVYNDGWNDTRISKELGVALNVVARRRVEIFGQMAKAPPIHATNYEMNGKLAALDGKVTTLNGGFTLLDGTVAALQTRLAAEETRIADIEKAISTLIIGFTSGRNAIDPRKLQELQAHFNKTPTTSK